MKKRAVGTTVKVLQKYVGGSTVEEFLVLSKWTTHRSLFFYGSVDRVEEVGLQAGW